MSHSIPLPQRRRHARQPTRLQRPRRLAGTGVGPVSTASPTRPRTWSPIRGPRSTRGCEAAIDWDATIAYRGRLWSLGLGVAEAMDTAQRGMGLDWPTSLELIRRSLDAARDVPGALSPRAAAPTTWRSSGEERRRCDPAPTKSRWRPSRRLGGKLIVMASRALARVASSPGRLRAGLRPHPAPGAAAGRCCTGWATCSTPRWPATGAAATSMRRWTRRWASSHAHAGQGRRHQDLAARQGQGDRHAHGGCRAGVRMYTGDDFNYAELIAGDGDGSRRSSVTAMRCWASSTPIAPAASAALAALAAGDARRASTRSWPRRCRCRATSSRRRPGSTRPAWSSWPGSTATRTTSPWWAGSRARAPCRISPNCSGWPMPPACSSSRNSPRGGCAICLRCTVSMPEAQPCNPAPTPAHLTPAH